jgi:hypothetical protein
MNMRNLKVGDEFVAVRSKQRSKDDHVLRMVVTRVGRKYVYAKDASADTRWIRERQFDRNSGWESADFQPMRAYQDRETYEQDCMRQTKVLQAEHSMRDNGRKWDRLSDTQLDVLIALLSKLNGKEPTP